MNVLRLSLLSLLCLAACAACATTREPVAATPAEPATATPAATPAEPEATPEMAEPDPAGRAKLGEACPAEPPRGEARRYCDLEGKVAGVVLPVDAIYGVPPPAAEILRQEPPGGGRSPRSLTVALEGERLWVVQVTCGQCRRVLGWTFGGDLPRLADDDLRELQGKLGLPADPVLRTPADWRAAAPRIPLAP